MEIKNAIIEGMSLTTADRDLLTAYIHLDYGDGGHQAFGGLSLYLPKSYKHHGGKNYAGHFIYRVMQVAGVTDWKDLKGKTLRVKGTMSHIEAVGHIVKDDWFNPKDEFEQMP